jgi:hypothetical protein
VLLGHVSEDWLRAVRSSFGFCSIAHLRLLTRPTFAVDASLSLGPFEGFARSNAERPDRGGVISQLFGLDIRECPQCVKRLRLHNGGREADTKNWAIQK